MVKAKCIQKIRDNSGKIVTYTLEDENGNRTNVPAYSLKNSMIYKQIDITNLKLTSDGRLIDKKDTEQNDDVQMIDEGTSLVEKALRHCLKAINIRGDYLSTQGDITYFCIKRHYVESSEVPFKTIKPRKSVSNTYIGTESDSSYDTAYMFLSKLTHSLTEANKDGSLNDIDLVSTKNGSISLDKNKNSLLTNFIVKKTMKFITKKIDRARKRIENNSNNVGKIEITNDGQTTELSKEQMQEVLKASSDIMNIIMNIYNNGPTIESRQELIDEIQNIGDRALLKEKPDDTDDTDVPEKMGIEKSIDTLVFYIKSRLIRNSAGGYLVEYVLKIRGLDANGNEINDESVKDIERIINYNLDIVENKTAVARAENVTQKDIEEVHYKIAAELTKNIRDLYNYGYLTFKLRNESNRIVNEVIKDKAVQQMRTAAEQRLKMDSK